MRRARTRRAFRGATRRTCPASGLQIAVLQQVSAGFVLGCRPGLAYAFHIGYLLLEVFGDCAVDILAFLTEQGIESDLCIECFKPLYLLLDFYPFRRYLHLQ